jgi:hypothetical protein
MISLAKIFKFPVEFFSSLGQNVVKAHIRHVRQVKRDVNDMRFVQYRDDYRKKKIAGKAAKSGERQISNSGTPDLTLTGKMLNSMRLIKATSQGFFYGITDPREAAKMIGHQTGNYGGRISKNKRTTFMAEGKRQSFIAPSNRAKIRKIAGEKIRDNPIPPQMQEMITREMSKQIVRQISQEIRSKGMGVKVYEI